LKFLIPLDEGAFADIEVCGDAAKAPALGAELEELFFGLFGVHGGVG